MRRASFMVTPQKLKEVLQLPSASEIIGARWDFSRQCIDVMVTDPSFPDVEDGMVAYEVRPQTVWK